MGRSEINEDAVQASHEALKASRRKRLVVPTFKEKEIGD